MVFTFPELTATSINLNVRFAGLNVMFLNLNLTSVGAERHVPGPDLMSPEVNLTSRNLNLTFIEHDRHVPSTLASRPRA